MATFTKRGDGWFVQVRRKGFPHQHRTFQTKAAGKAWASEQEARIDCGQGSPIPAPLPRLTDLLARYVADVVPHHKGAVTERSRVEKLRRVPLCAMRVDELTPSMFAAFRDARLAVVKPQTVKHELSVFRRVLRLAQREWGLVLRSDPLAPIAMPSVRNGRDRRFEGNELSQLTTAFNQTRNSFVRPLVLFSIETALRRGELLKLRWRDVDERRRVATIRETKTGHDRTIPLTDAALGILASLPRGRDVVFPVSADTLRRAWDRATARAGLTNLRLHDCRHEAISRFAEMGLSAPELSVISGHRDLRMLSRYTHLRPADLAKKLAGRCWTSEEFKHNSKP